MWSYREHQVEGAEWVLATVRQYGLAYLSWQERTGKTGTAIKTIENSKAKTCLIVTKKKAIDGWLEAIENFPTTKEYVVINYESIHKVEGDFDFITLDECFVAGTLVDGKCISEYKVGEYVTTREGKKRVYNISKKQAPDLCKVTIGGRVIICTLDHLFFTENRGWIKIKEATNEDVFVLQD